MRKQVKKSTEGTVKKNRRDKTPLPNTIKSKMCNNTALEFHVFDIMGVASPSARKLIKKEKILREQICLYFGEICEDQIPESNISKVYVSNQDF